MASLTAFIDVNRASSADLQRLPGVGAKTAQRIMEERRKRPFKSVDGWNVGASAPAWAKATALISLVCWSAAIACGRLLAYF